VNNQEIHDLSYKGQFLLFFLIFESGSTHLSVTFIRNEKQLKGIVSRDGLSTETIGV
jgi:hypothetical protein